MLLLLLLAAGIVRSVSVHAQLAGSSDVIYRKCWNATTFEEGRFEHCGVDEAATREYQSQLAELEQRAEKATQPLTPVQEKAVLERIEERLQIGTESSLQSQLLSLLQTARERLSRLLSNDAYAFDAQDRNTLQVAAHWIDEQIGQYESGPVQKNDVRQVRQELGSELSKVARIVTAARRESAATGPRVESIVTRIDDLVARVGTVIRDLERSGESVPSDVKTGHRRAADLVREAKATCSTSRPVGCTQLRTILEMIEEMREPLCAIESPILTFCH